MALKGAQRVICVDNDPQALEATVDNAERNDVSQLIECHSPDTYDCTGADIVLANILASPLIQLAPLLLGSIRPPGLLALSGILKEQTDEVITAYRDGLNGISVKSREEWVLLQGQRV